MVGLRSLAQHRVLDLHEVADFGACFEHRSRPLGEQLHGFMWNRKQKYAVLLVEALDLERVPRPLDRVLAHV